MHLLKAGRVSLKCLAVRFRGDLERGRSATTCRCCDRITYEQYIGALTLMTVHSVT
jgi:hypothetical protein